VNAGGVEWWVCDKLGDSPLFGFLARRSLVILSACLSEVLSDLVRGEALGRGGNGRWWIGVGEVGGLDDQSRLHERRDNLPQDDAFWYIMPSHCIRTIPREL
jgi:hypothetical protein